MLCTVALNACLPPEGDAPDGSTSFSADVQPILNRSCAGCHSAGGFADQAGIPLRLNRGAAWAALVNQPSALDADLTLVVPGDPDASFLMDKLTSENPAGGSRMPLFAGPLSEAEIAILRTWIAEGAADN